MKNYFYFHVFPYFFLLVDVIMTVSSLTYADAIFLTADLAEAKALMLTSTAEGLDSSLISRFNWGRS
jgi:hypothetical protein